MKASLLVQSKILSHLSKLYAAYWCLVSGSLSDFLKPSFSVLIDGTLLYSRTYLPCLVTRLGSCQACKLSIHHMVSEPNCDPW